MNIHTDIFRILCYGDSNTWGYIPNTIRHRYEPNERFTGILQQLLGDKYEIIEEGLNSRTLISSDNRPGKEGRNGSDYLIPCLDSQDPIDLVVLMLGTNELKKSYDNTAKQIGDLLEQYFVTVILNRKSQFKNSVPKLVIVSPPEVDETTMYASKLYKDATNKSKELGSIYKKIADKYSCDFISASTLEVADGVHMTKESHKKLAEMLYEVIITK